jgi:hypothetical protein
MPLADFIPAKPGWPNSGRIRFCQGLETKYYKVVFRQKGEQIIPAIYIRVFRQKKDYISP